MNTENYSGSQVHLAPHVLMGVSNFNPARTLRFNNVFNSFIPHNYCCLCQNITESTESKIQRIMGREFTNLSKAI